MKRLLILVLVLLLLVTGAAIWYVTWRPPESGPPTQVMIPPGTSFRTMTDTLVARDIVRHRTWFTALARIRGLDRSVQAGAYEFRQGASAWQILNTLRSGRTAAVRFTVPEGLSMFELAALARLRLGIPAESTLAAARDTALAREFDIAGPSLEGFLYPETYQVPVGSTARELVTIMLREFQRQWDPAWDQRIQALGLSRRDLISLASIVEGEARMDSERKVIAGVYYNRLRIGMPLQADPTVQYAIEMKTGHPKTRLYEKDYLTPSPWNTYLHPGLPPGPVNSPGRASIEATLHPAQVPFLYFVAGPDGSHLFSRTYAEHLRAVNRARQSRR